MRNPFRSEAEAFSFVIVAALVFLVVALVKESYAIHHGQIDYEVSQIADTKAGDHVGVLAHTAIEVV